MYPLQTVTQSMNSFLRRCLNHNLSIRLTVIEEVSTMKDRFLELLLGHHGVRGRLELAVKLLAVRIGAVLDHGLTDLIASLEIHRTWRWPLIDLLVSHPGRRCS